MVNIFKRVVASVLQIKCRRGSQHGSTHLELIAVLPVLGIFLVGIGQLGREFSQIAWFSSINYETALAGAQANTDVGVDTMRATFERLYELHNNSGPNRMEGGQLEGDPVYDTAVDRTVRVRSEGTAQTLLSMGFMDQLNLRFHVDYISPILLREPDLSAGNLNTFINPALYYDCNGIGHASPVNSQTPCDGPPPPPPPPYVPVCFSGDTPITMADGTQRAIVDIKVGEMVLAYDEESATNVPAMVSRLIRNKTHEYYILNGHIRVTGNHPLYADGKWTKVRRLRLGQSLLSITGEFVPVRTIEKVVDRIPVYNLTVESQHNYYAAGVLAHNVACYSEEEANNGPRF